MEFPGFEYVWCSEECGWIVVCWIIAWLLEMCGEDRLIFLFDIFDGIQVNFTM